MVVKGDTTAEVEFKAAQQLAAWGEQEAKRRERERQLNLKSKAEFDNKNAQERLAALHEILRRGLIAGKKFDWKAMKNNSLYPEFEFREPAPAYEQLAQVLEIPNRKPFLEAIFSSVRKKREGLETEARNELIRLQSQYEAHKAETFRVYQEKQRAFEQEKVIHNASIDEKQTLVEAGDIETVIWFLKKILDNLDFPESYGKDFELAFDAASGIAIISMQLPNLIEVPRVSGYKYVAARKAIDTIEMKQKELEALYDSIIYQMALLTIHRVFREAYISHLRSIVFNGWVTGIDRSTGNNFTSCILSVQAAREIIQAINLERVDPKECIRSLKGLVAGPLAQLAPVRPILELDTFDKRFVESREVLAGLNSMDNLATMDWADFEHLVRELFAKIFGTEVRVTQASRDGGVDAIAFDPDPIRGGKFVIQAKRYNNIVPVSAVRDLYGTMINEGAVKGLLVTTSYYGNDSREFVKDKPITLIDGSNLVHMFQQYGYNFKIKLQ
jgi:restriction system protein